MARIDLAGMRFGRLTVIGPSHSETHPCGARSLLWICRCVCGREKIINGSNLRSRRTQSCGCLQKEAVKRTRVTHGQSDHRLYNVWTRMIDRCENTNNRDFQHYGGRGIQVCDRWHSFDLFLGDMEPEWKEGLTLERKDVNGGYSPENVRWATQAEQTLNTRRSRIIDTPWGPMNACLAADRVGINRYVFLMRLKRGWPPEKLFSKKRYTRWHKGD